MYTHNTLITIKSQLILKTWQHKKHTNMFSYNKMIRFLIACFIIQYNHIVFVIAESSDKLKSAFSNSVSDSIQSWSCNSPSADGQHKLTLCFLIGCSNPSALRARIRIAVRVYDGPLSNKSHWIPFILQPHTDVNIVIRALVALYVLTDHRNENAHIEANTVYCQNHEQSFAFTSSSLYTKIQNNKAL